MPAPIVVWLIVAGARAAAPHVIRYGAREIVKQGGRRAARRGAKRQLRKKCQHCKPKCLVGPHSLIQALCSAQGGKAHHIIPDRVYRLQAGKNSPRIANAPTYGEGMAVCLKNQRTHDAVHRKLDRKLGALNGGSGAAPMAQIAKTSTDALDPKTSKLSKKCHNITRAAAAEQLRGTTGFTQLGRSSKNPLKGAALSQLKPAP